MGEKSKIEWTDTTWNPWQGCHKVSPGCLNCYMFAEKKRYGQDPNVVVRSKPRTFNLPLRLREPRLVFTCSWSDFFIEEADEWRPEAWDIIAATPHLTYQILTKRIERVAGLLPWGDGKPWDNVWILVSVEDQKRADERIPILLCTNAAVRGVSIEPMLGPIDVARYVWPVHQPWPSPYKSPEEAVEAGATLPPKRRQALVSAACTFIDWVIVGGESGPNARPMHPDWARSIRDQCVTAGVPFFFKQMGEWAQTDGPVNCVDPEQAPYPTFARVGKKVAGCALDGRTWDEMPEVRT